jgi:hypothetical protein
MSAGIRELQMELNEKRSELRQLQEERITKGKTDRAAESPETLKGVIEALNAEIAVLKVPSLS